MIRAACLVVGLASSALTAGCAKSVPVAGPAMEPTLADGERVRVEMALGPPRGRWIGGDDHAVVEVD